MKKAFSGRLPGLSITILLTVALTLFMAILIKTKMLPSKLLLLAGVLFLLFVVLLLDHFILIIMHLIWILI